LKCFVELIRLIDSVVAGLAIALRCAAVILGINKPFVVLLTSSMALALAWLPVLLIPTFCACITVAAVVEMLRQGESVS